MQDTYGILVYQEQIIRIASDLAGDEPGEADMIRKAVSKKKQSLIDQHRITFTQGAMARGYSQQVCDAIWGDIEFFARYGFNKSHGADYAMITGQTAFLKAHYPVEYFAALLTVERDNSEKVARYISDSRRMGIPVKPPSINTAEVDFIIEDEAHGPVIRYGMGAIKNAGISAIEHILVERRANGPFKDLLDLSERVDLRKVGRRALESMIKVGVFDRWVTRPQLLDSLDRLLGYSGKEHDARAVGQLSLFGGTGLGGGRLGYTPQLITPLEELKHPAGKKEQLVWEKELIGVYLSDHPLTRVVEQVADWVNAGTATIDRGSHDRGVRMVGLVASLRLLTTKKGDPMAFGQLEDLDGSIEVVFFPRTWKAVRDVVKTEQVLFITGKVQADDRGMKVIVDSASDKQEMAGATDSQPYYGNGFERHSEPPISLLRDADEYPGIVVESEDAVPWEVDDEPKRTVAGRNAGGIVTAVTSSTKPPPPPNFEESAESPPPLPLVEVVAPSTQRNAGNGQGKPKTVVVAVRPHQNWRQTFREKSEHYASTYHGQDTIHLIIEDPIPGPLLCHALPKQTPPAFVQSYWKD